MSRAMAGRLSLTISATSSSPRSSRLSTWRLGMINECPGRIGATLTTARKRSDSMNVMSATTGAQKGHFITFLSIPQSGSDSRMEMCNLSAVREGAREELRQPQIERLLVLGPRDAVPLVLEGQHLEFDVVPLQGVGHDPDVFRRDVRVLQTLHDEQPALDIRHEVDRRPFVIFFGSLIRPAAHHLLAVRAQVGARRVVVDGQIGNAANRRGRGGEVLREAGDGAPRRVAAVRRAGHADLALLGDACCNQRLYAGPYIVLLAPAPAVDLDRLAEGQAEAGAAAIVRIEHVEALSREELNLVVDRVGAVKSRSAVDEHDRASRPLARLRPIQPALYLQSIDGLPSEVLRRRQVVGREQGALPHTAQAGEASRIRVQWREAHQVGRP